MTDKELRKLTRAELLELLLVQSREIDRLNTQVEELYDQIRNREINLAQTGNIAEAALKLNQVFEAAQAAADEYLQNVMNPVSDTQKRCEQMLEETRQQCNHMTEEARERIHKIWQIIRQEIYNPKLDYPQWQKISDYIDNQLTKY